MSLRKKHKRVLDSIFEKPTRSNIKWTDIIKLLTALDAKISQRSGSRVAVLLNGKVSVFHEPHPQKETKEGAVNSMRTFLKQAGCTPENLEDEDA